MADVNIAPTAPMTGNPWSADFDPPTTHTTNRVRFEPLAPKYADIDFEAAMGSREHLQRTLQWGSWPRADFTVEENAKDLERHLTEFENREAYAYTVLTPDRSRCVGCIYLNPADPNAPRTAMLAYWVVEDELVSDLDRHVLDEFFAWVERDWPLDGVMLPLHNNNVRGANVVRDIGLIEAPMDMEDHQPFMWMRGR